jgi:hypothetical protein
MTSVITAASGDPFTYFVALKYTASRARAFYERERKLSAKKATKGKRKMDRSILERKEKEARVITLYLGQVRLLERASNDFCARVGVLQVRHPGDSPVRGGVRSGGHLIFFCLCVLNEDFFMCVAVLGSLRRQILPLFSQKYARRVVVVVVLREQQQQDNNKETSTNDS